MITEIRQVQKKYCSQAMLAAIAAAFILIMAGAKPEGKGLLLGALFSVFNFILMGYAMPLRMGVSTKKSFAVSLGSIWVRYLILALPLILALKSDSLNVFTVAAGLFMVQATILYNHLSKMIGTVINRRRSTA